MNPYNCSIPGNLFAGYEAERSRIVTGLLENQKSFAIFGGRRCGKTSLLMRLEKDILARALPHVQTRFIDMDAIIPRTTGEFFCALYNSIVAGFVDAPAAPAQLRDFSEFLSLLGQASKLIEAHLGPHWLLVLLVDKFDAAASSLSDETAFQNLRYLLTMSAYSGAIRVIVTGSSRLDDLISVGSPLNILEPVYLGVLLERDAVSVIRAGFRDTNLDAELLAETGCHPYILQGVLAYLWEERQSPDVGAAARRFSRDRTSNFKHWIRDIGEDGVVAYRTLARSSAALEKSAIKTRNALRDEVLQALMYHGIVEDSDNRLRVSSRLFCRWFIENVTSPGDSPVLDQKAAKAKKVFVVHGRNHRVRAAMFLLLREIGLQPLDWGDLVEATGNPAPAILEVLRAGFETAQAAVVLFTPEDEARVPAEFRRDGDPPEERELMLQPRPNVIFEAGMAMALFPRATILAQVGHIRQFTDLAGVHFVRLDNTLDSRKDLLRRLRMAGCEIDVSEIGTGWQDPGKFVF